MVTIKSFSSIAFVLRLAIVLAGLMIVSETADAQQMVVLRRGKVNMRFNLGDDIRFTRKNEGKQIYHVAILAIREFDFVTLQKDTIKFSEIAKLKFDNPARRKYGQGTVLTAVALGALGFAMEQPFGDKNPQAIRGLKTVGVLGAAFGTFFILTSKSTIRLNGKSRLKYLHYDSPLYN